jgi:hypothetical protein
VDAQMDEIGMSHERRSRNVRRATTLVRFGRR